MGGLTAPAHTSRFVFCLLGAAALTAFLMHLGAADPWLGGVAVPATVWVAWIAIDMARASRRRARLKRDALPHGEERR